VNDFNAQNMHCMSHGYINKHRWYSLKDKKNMDAGSVRLRTALEGDHSAHKIQEIVPSSDTPSSSDKDRSNLSRSSSHDLPRTPAGPLRHDNALHKDSLISPAGSPSAPASTMGWGRFGKGRTPRGARVPVPHTPNSPMRRDGSSDGPLAQEGTVQRPLLPAQRTFQYKLGEMVGRGAFGKVFQAMNLENGELMAVK
jgi:hypothetical protein